MQKIIFTLIQFTLLFSSCANRNEKQSLTGQQLATGRLNKPFGTILKLEVEIVDGDELQLKETTSKYLLKVLRIEDSTLNNPIQLPFEDETGLFPTDHFELYEHLNKKTTGTLSEEEFADMNKHYAGKRFRIVAYESGKFSGLPDGYNEYLDERADKSFHFKNYLIVIGKP